MFLRMDLLPKRIFVVCRRRLFTRSVVVREIRKNRANKKLVRDQAVRALDNGKCVRSENSTFFKYLAVNGKYLM